VNLPGTLQASAQHIGLLQDRRRRLTAALVGAELQFLVALRREYEAGEMNWTEMADAYRTLSAGNLRGTQSRWMDAIPVSPKRVNANAELEAALVGLAWRGHWPLDRRGRHAEAYPPSGQRVVYMLLDVDDLPLLLGSTNQCRRRFATHDANGLRWSSWIALGCADRAQATCILRGCSASGTGARDEDEPEIGCGWPPCLMHGASRTVRLRRRP
jgi:hypothetical protein